MYDALPCHFIQWRRTWWAWPPCLPAWPSVDASSALFVINTNHHHVVRERSHHWYGIRPSCPSNLISQEEMEKGRRQAGLCAMLPWCGWRKRKEISTDDGDETKGMGLGQKAGQCLHCRATGHALSPTLATSVCRITFSSSWTRSATPTHSRTISHQCLYDHLQ